MPRIPANLDDHALIQHNVRVESFFSAYNGVYLGLAIFLAPVVAVTLQASLLELTILISAFPVGAFMGPLWAFLGRRWGMQKLVTQMALWANVPLFFIFFLSDPETDSAWFTALITVSQLLNSAMRMGQSSMYRVMYPRELRGRVLGRLTLWSYLTLVPSILLTGWLLKANTDTFRYLYPLAGICGLIGAWYYGHLYVPPELRPPVTGTSIRAGIRGVRRILTQDRAYLFFQFAFFLSGSSFFMSTHVILQMTEKTFEFSPFELALWMSVVPQILLALGSPAWGRIVDRFGIVRCRLLVSALMTSYLTCYFLGIYYRWPGGIILGSLLQGTSNGGGQLTWSLASSHFAPRVEDVGLYNGIHFVLNGIRGLIMPWVGSLILITAGGPAAILTATFLSLASVPIVLKSIGLGEGEEEPALPMVAAKQAEKSRL